MLIYNLCTTGTVVRSFSCSCPLSIDRDVKIFFNDLVIKFYHLSKYFFSQGLTNGILFKLVQNNICNASKLSEYENGYFPYLIAQQVFREKILVMLIGTNISHHLHFFFTFE